MKVYLDSAPIIYLIEGNEQYREEVMRWGFTEGHKSVTCGLSITECLAKPYADGNSDLVNAFEEFFRVQLDELIPLTPECFHLAARLRARHRLNTADAVHIAAAIQGGCAKFVTNDHQLKSVNLIDVQLLSGAVK